MPLFTKKKLIETYQIEKSRRDTKMFSERTVLNENTAISQYRDSFDIFLSHNSLDKKLLSGLVLNLEKMGYSVYVDWQDARLNPNKVSSETAEILRSTMGKCDNLIFAFSENSINSRWMPWELGYFDALSDSKVAVLPIAEEMAFSYVGVEYLGLYNYVKYRTEKGKDKLLLCKQNTCIDYSDWLPKTSSF